MDTESNEVITREYRPGDEGQIAELLDLVFEGWPKFNLSQSNLYHWMWKYQDNYTDRKIVVVNDLDGRIIGASHILVFHMKFFDNVSLTGVGGDAVVHPDFRGMGLHREKLKLTIKITDELGVDFNYAITSNPVVIGMFERNPRFQRFPVDLNHYVMIRDIDLHLQNNKIERAWVTKIGYQTFKLISSLQSSNPNISEKTDISVREIDAFDERIDDFWKKIHPEYDIIIVNDQKYLNWRYTVLGAGPFIIYLAEEENEIVGFIILRTNRFRPEYPTGFIAELLVSPGRTDVVYALLKTSMKMFNDEGVNIVSFLGVKNYKYEKCLKDFGFIDSRRNHNIFVLLSKKGEKYNEKIQKCPSNRVHFSFGNLDII